MPDTNSEWRIPTSWQIAEVLEGYAKMLDRALAQNDPGLRAMVTDIATYLREAAEKARSDEYR